jgi:hypothetical protein
MPNLLGNANLSIGVPASCFRLMCLIKSPDFTAPVEEEINAFPCQMIRIEALPPHETKRLKTVTLNPMSNGKPANREISFHPRRSPGRRTARNNSHALD